MKKKENEEGRSCWSFQMLTLRDLCCFLSLFCVINGNRGEKNGERREEEDGFL